MNSRNDCHGNVLFLILIAVALFAALSYAVTSSSRGGGNSKKDSADAVAGLILDHIATYQQTIQRLKITGGYKQILFDGSAANNNGTCYDAQASLVTPCKTIGLFSQEAGAKGLILKGNQTISGWYDVYAYIVRTQVNSIEVGTTKQDMVVYIEGISKEVCEKINLKLNNTTMSSYGANISANPSWPWALYFWWEGSYLGYQNGGLSGWRGINMPVYSGCFFDSDATESWYTLYSILEQN